MKLPRNIDGDELASLLSRYGIVSLIRPAAISVCLWIAREKPMT
jgi:hypothetical protein